MQACLELIPDETKRVFLAYSGGLDSSVLLHLLTSQARAYEIVPWHINHGLLDVAMEMEDFCLSQAKSYHLALRVDRLHLGDIKSNIEAEARRQRYQLFQQGTVEGDCVLTAHHADDKAETFLLNALRYGCPPHGGIAFGLDRMVMLMAGASSIRDVMACPKTQTAACLLTQAPSPVSDKQLRELSIRVRKPALES